MNWVKKMNAIDNEICQYVYDMCIDIYNDIEKDLLKYNTTFNELINKSIKLSEEKQYKKLINYISKEYENIVTIYKVEINDIFEKYIHSYNNALCEMYDIKLDEIKTVMISLNQKQLTMFYKRLRVIFKNHENKLFYFLNDLHMEFQKNIIYICNLFKDYAFEIISIIKSNSNCDFINSNYEFKNYKLSSMGLVGFIDVLNSISYIIQEIDDQYFVGNIKDINNVIEEKENHGIKYQKIFNYKELAKLATSNLYNYKYTNGSHQIFENKNSKKIVVIPTHDIGKGLSIKIQKQIYNNSI